MSVFRMLFAAVVPLCIAAFSAAAPKPEPKPKKKRGFPKFAAVKRAVQKSLKERRGYRDGDILSRTDVERALKSVEKLGWKVAGKKQVLAATLADSDYLVRQLRSRRGIPFMRKLSGNAENYDRLDRLRRLKYGKRRIRELIIGPDGHTLIQYMTTTPGGKYLGRYLSRTPSGNRFNEVTGRIYRDTQLIKWLRASHRAEVVRRRKSRRTPKKKKTKTLATLVPRLGLGTRVENPGSSNFRRKTGRVSETGAFPGM
ncbi:MAG: hypothetical protein ACE5KM_11525 [Planctomycetaceae bacterium]